ncbi:hypothetical protein D3C77_799500 [compost metagenome]
MLAVEVEQPAQGAGDAGTAAQVQGIEHADLDVRVGGERGDFIIAPVAGGVVEQHAHAHAPVGGAQQFLHQ